MSFLGYIRKYGDLKLTALPTPAADGAVPLGLRTESAEPAAEGSHPLDGDAELALAGQKMPPEQRRILLGTVALIAACLISSVLGVRQLRRDATEDATRSTHTLGVVVAEETTRSLQAVSLVLKELEHQVQLEGVRTPEGFHDLLATHALFQDLNARLRDLPQSESLSIVGINGRLVNVTRSWPPPNVDLSDRDYVQYCKPGNRYGTYVSAPVKNRISGTLDFYIMRCVNGSDAQPLGLLTAAMQINFFQRFYASIGLAPGMTVTLRRTDGTLLVSYRDAFGAAARAKVPDPVWLDAVAAGHKDYRAAATDDAPARFVSVNRIDDFPIVVTVTLTEDVAYARWRQQAIAVGIFVVLTLGCILILLRALKAQLTRLKASRTSLRHRNRQLRAAARALQASQEQVTAQSAALETTLEHMDQGLMMVTGERIVAVCNRRAMEMLDLPPKLMLSRPSFGAVLAQQWQTEEFKFTTESIKEFVRKGGILDQPHSYERRRPNGRWIQVHSVPLASGGVVRTYTDVTDRKLSEEKLAYQAHHDELTKLANRVLFHAELDRMIEAARSEAASFAVLYLDLDRFKLVNDTRGHAAGDRLLMEVADRMRACLRPVDRVARLGGDEFAVLLPCGANQEVAMSFAWRLRQRLAEPYEIDGGVCHVGASIGIAVFPGDGATADLLLRAADGALYQAKNAGRDAIRCHEEASEVELLGNRLLEQDLRRALELDQFELCYQPIFHLETGVPYSFEALLRWRHPQRGVISPGAFIPMAERIGVIAPIGRWVIETACREAATWAFPVRLAVNLSPLQFDEPDLEQHIMATLAATGLPAERLDLEVTEGMLASDTGQFRAAMHSLRKNGIRLALDDFGTAYSSLSKLQGFPFQQIKIDRSFVNAIHDDENSIAILQAVFNMAVAMRLEVVVEGVETRAQLDTLGRLGCHFVQGYLLGRPQSPEWTREYLWQWHTNRSDPPAVAAAPGASTGGSRAP